MKIPTAAQYKKAFLAICPQMHEKHLELLQAHYAAPAHTISVDALAKAVGDRQIQGQYGRLGRLLCDELGLEPTMREKGKPVFTQVLANAPTLRSEESWEWTMRPEVVKALSELGWVDQPEPVNAFILTWNPTMWHWNQDDYAEDVQATKEGRLFASQWSCGNTKRIRPGDRVYLIRQGTSRGLIGYGFATTEAFADRHWDESRDDTANYVKLQGDTLVDTEERLPIEQLIAEDLGVPWNNLYASGVQVPADSVHKLEQIWTKHLLMLGKSIPAKSPSDTDGPSSVSKNDEIDRILCEINQRRGQPAFRGSLLDAYGNRCAVTGCSAMAALEAAHIIPYSEAMSCEVTNGLLLRADSHTLFDLNLIGIEPSSLEVVLAKQLLKSSYKKLDGKKLTLPDKVRLRPSKDALRKRWREFKKAGNL